MLPATVLAQTVPDVGPCNENYEFVCDSEDNCTCVKKGNPRLRLVILDEPFYVSLGPSDTLELVAGFDPDDYSACDITYDVELETLDGKLLESGSGYLQAGASFSIHEYRLNAAGGTRTRARIRLGGDAVDCSLQEIKSFRPTVATYRGHSGEITSHSPLGYRFKFELAPGELPALLPPASVPAPCEPR
jgi:hypothetical protein